MKEFIVEVKSLSKWFGLLNAVDNVSFQVRQGTSFGLLGLNGAGKTTIFKMMASLIRPDKGTAIIAGYDVVKQPMKVRSHIGYVAENPTFYARMTTIETLNYLCRLLDVPVNKQKQRIDSALNLVGLMDKKNALVGGYSRGMRHRLGLAQALLSEPKVLFLDEPTLGLDPLGAKNMRDLILRLRQGMKITVLMSSHVLPEVESICDEVGIFDHGHLIAVDTITNLRSTARPSMQLQLQLSEPNENVNQAIREIPGVLHVKNQGNIVLIEAQKKQALRPQIVSAAINNHAQILAFTEQGNTLEDILLGLVNTGADERTDADNPITYSSLIELLLRKLRT